MIDHDRQINPIASALMAKMNIAKEDRPRVKLECLKLLANLKLSPAKMKLIASFVDTYLKLNTKELQRFQEEFEHLAPKQKESVMELTTSWEQQGFVKGKIEGKQEEASYFMKRLLEIKLGCSSPKKSPS
ncbi:MAG: hypothetical protein R2865_05860 [Deinococcales bacterium]